MADYAHDADSPAVLREHNSKAKYKDYLFAIHTLETAGRKRTNGSIDETLGKFVEVKVVYNKSPILTMDRKISDNPRCSNLFHMAVKKDIEDNPLDYVKLASQYVPNEEIDSLKGRIEIIFDRLQKHYFGDKK